MRVSDWSSDMCSSDLEQVESDPDVALAGRGEGACDVVDDLHARPPCVRQAGIAAFGDPACGIGGPSVAGRAARITAFLRECPMASARSARSPAAPTAVLPRARTGIRPRDWPAAARRGQLPPEAGAVGTAPGRDKGCPNVKN